MSERQFVAVRFQPHARRTYTYHNDGSPLAVGDRAKVEGRGGWQEVEVVEIVMIPPPFATKPLGPRATGEAQGLLALREIERERIEDDRNRGA